MISNQVAYLPRSHKLLQYLEQHGPSDCPTAAAGIGLPSKLIWRNLTALVDAGFLSHEPGPENRRLYFATRPSSELPQVDPRAEQQRMAEIRANRVQLRVGSRAPSISTTRTHKGHEALRARLAADVERFLQAGNVIEELPGPRDPVAPKGGQAWE